MRKQLLLFGFILSLIIISCSNSKKMTEKDFEQKDPFEKMFNVLDSVWTEEERNTFKNEPEENLVSYHMSVGMWMRNNYLRGKDTDTVLVDSLLSYGLKSPDDISSVVLEAYHKKLNDKEIDIKALTKPYREYWEEMERNQKEE